MNRFYKVITILITLVSSVVILSSNVMAEEFIASKFTLDNGLRVVAKELPNSPMVAVYGLVKTGSATEDKYLGTGVSHFLEHMLFKGTTKRKIGEISSQIQAVGGFINASTSFDYTIYVISVPYEHFDLALDVLSDMLMNSVLAPAEVEKEREVVFNEMRLYKDDPGRELSELALRTVYTEHPYRHPVIGYESVLADVSREQLMDYYKDRYVPNNIVLSIAGNISIKDVRPKIESVFKDCKRGREILRNLPDEPDQITPRYSEVEFSTDLTRMSIAFSGVQLMDHDLYALDILAQILGQGDSSRLYSDLYSQRKMVYSIYASNFTPLDRGVFEVESLLDYENVEQVKKAILDHIEIIKKKGVQADELKKAKQQFLSKHIYENQSASQVAYSLAFDEAFTGDYQFSEKYLKAVHRITEEDIKRVAKLYLKQEVMTTVVVKPVDSSGAAEEQAVERVKGEIKKYTLENGLTVLLREDHTYPLASIHLIANGGLRLEPKGFYGISDLVSNVWIKGTKSMSADQWARRIDSLGMSMGGFSGKNSFGLNLRFLSEDIQEAFELLEDAIKDPVFPEEEIEKLKRNMKVSISQRKDDVFRFTQNNLMGELFPTHPYRYEPVGTEESIDKITRNDVKNFYDRHVVPNNMVLVVFGDIDSRRVEEWIAKKFGSLPKKDLNFQKYERETLIRGVKEKIFELDKEQVTLMFGFHGVEMSDKDRYGVDVLSAILGSSFSGRLFGNVRDKLGKAYRLGGDSVPGIEPGYIYFYVVTDPASMAQAKELVLAEIKNIQNDFVSETELNNIKTYLKGSYKASLETNDAISFAVGLDELYGLGFDDYAKYDTYIDRVTQEDILALAKKYLDLNKMVIVITMPPSKSIK